MKLLDKEKIILFIKKSKYLIIILLLLIYKKLIKKEYIKKKINDEINEIISNFNITNTSDFINKLNNYSYLRTPKNILICDYLYSPFCDDFNGYSLFEYYLEKKVPDVYYLINSKTYFYQSLLKQKKTKNVIPISPRNNFYNDLFKYILNSKILIQSYSLFNFHEIVSNVSYLKYLNLNHGIRYFKKKIESYDFDHLIRDKRNLILTSPFEYDLLLKQFNHSEKYLHKAGMPKYDRFNNIKKNESEKDCILVSFTYRKYDNSIYNQSLLKKNLKSLLNNNYLISLLGERNIDLIYIPHHHDLFRNRNFDENQFIYAKFYNNTFLTHYIEQCSLFITDFSSVAFDFMFQKKPALFYFIDVNDSFDFEEKEYMKYPNDTIYFGNVFNTEENLINKIEYYIKNKFDIGEEMKKNYNSVFFYKNNIRKRIVEIVNNIINNNTFN
jgi:CDP-glycerol glycerophosphotransferase (TagB/SpsB family)